MGSVMKLLLVLGLAALVAGCEATAVSDRNEPGWQTTPSYDKIMSAKGTPNPTKPRSWPATKAEYEPPVVTHFGSYFDDPFVYCGDGNDTYGWTWMDPVAVVYSPARMVVNTVAVPVSMIKEPPGVLQCTNLDQELESCGTTTRPCGTKGK